MAKILVLYYSQSGQGKQIADNICQSLGNNHQIIFERIEPEKHFPFPWTADTFFDAMPECVLEIPSPVQPPKITSTKDIDLVILVYQPWFLSPSQPVTSFLKSEWGKKLLSDKPVITLIGCRNMWLNAQEKIKKQLKSIDARLVANIVLKDRHGNLTSLITIIRWMFSGRKQASGMFPEAGVSQKDIAAATKFAGPIHQALVDKNFDTLQQSLLSQGGIELALPLMLMELKGHKAFLFWANYIREKGGPGAAERLPRVRFYKRLLITFIFILTPLSAIVATIKSVLFRKRTLKEAEYFKGIDLNL